MRCNKLYIFIFVILMVLGGLYCLFGFHTSVTVKPADEKCTNLIFERDILGLGEGDLYVL